MFWRCPEEEVETLKEQRRIVVIGGVACGPKAASRARRCDPKAKITVIEQGEFISYAVCGLPYYISGVIKERGALLVRTPAFFKKVAGIDVLTKTHVLSINRAAHVVETVNIETGQPSTISYDKLVLATGANPITPLVPGHNLKGIFTLKEMPDADTILTLITSQRAKKAVIIGAGVIGMEMAEALVTRGLKVTVVETLDRVLPTILDSEMAAFLSRHLERQGVNLLLGQNVTAFEGDSKGRARRVVTESTTLEADFVLSAMGVRPDTKLAEEAGLVIGPTGATSVNKYLQTSDPDIYAGGDCVENNHLVTGARVYFPSGSTANKHGRVIGTNVTGGHETFPGILGTSVLKVFDFTAGRVGLGEGEARAAGYDVVTSLVPNPDHAHYYPGAKDILVKLLAARKTGVILGGQVVGRGEVAKHINILATALTLGCNVDTLANLDLGYAPPYDSVVSPVHNAANVIRNKVSGLAKGLGPAEVKAKIAGNEDFILLDVRDKEEWERWRIEAPQHKLLPQEELRERCRELPKDKEIITMCRRGIRAYQAQRTLEGERFSNVKFLDGSIVAWPYETVGSEQNDNELLLQTDALPISSSLEEDSP